MPHHLGPARADASACGALARPLRRGAGSVFLAIQPWPPPPSAARSARCSCTSIPAAARPGQSPASPSHRPAGQGGAEAAPDAPAHRPLGGPQAAGPPRRHGLGAVRRPGAAPSRGPAGPLKPWTSAMGCRWSCGGGREARQPGRLLRRLPRWGAGPLPFPVFHGLLPSLRRHRAPAGWCRSPLGAAVAARSLGSALGSLPTAVALRGAAAGAGGAGGLGGRWRVVGVNR